MSSSSNVAASDLAAPAPSGATVPSGSQNASSIGARHGTDNAPTAAAEAVGETEPSLGRGQRLCKIPGRFTQNSEESLTASDLYKRVNQSSMASMSGEPSRKRARPAGPSQAQPPMVAAQPSTSGPGSRVSKAGEPSQKRAKTAGRIQGFSQVPAAQPSISGSSSQVVQVQDDASQPSTSVGIQTDALSTPPSTQDAATMPETSEHVDVGIQTVPQVDAPPQPSTSMGVQTDTAPTTHDAATMPETSEQMDVGIQTTLSSQEEASQTDSTCFLEFSATSSESCSPLSVSSCETQTGSGFSLEFTEVSSVSFLPVALLDSATQAEDPVGSFELSEVSSESVNEAAPQDPLDTLEPAEEPSTSTSNPATDALAALNQRTWTPTTPTPSSSEEPVARRLRSKAAVRTPVVSSSPSHDEGCVAGRLRSKTVVPTDVVSRSPSPIAHRLRQRGPANLEGLAAELPLPKTREELQERLKNLDQGSEEFMKEWSRGEKLLDNEDATNIFISETGEEFMAKVETSHGVHLVKNKDGLGMTVPEDLDFGTVRDYIKTDKELSVINSNTQVPEFMTMSKLLKEFGKTVRTAIYNLLSLEFAQTEDRLREAFEEPEFVKSHSMVMKLEKALEDLKKKLGRKLRTATSQDEKEKIEEKIKKINNQLTTMPKFQKFLLLSMSGSFTDIHVDFSGTSVFYHVIKGRKIFYVAPPTPENLELYKKIERHEFEDEWIGDMLFDQWVRIEIREGQTAMIPSGYLHFVYTPEDSIVIGGNFLMEKYVERQFEMSKLEDFCAENKFCGFDNLFRGFWSAMWSYVEHCIIPELTVSQPSHLVDMAKIFLEELALKLEGDLKKEEEDQKKKAPKKQENTDEDNVKWYTCAEKKMILEELERRCQ